MVIDDLHHTAQRNLKHLRLITPIQFSWSNHPTIPTALASLSTKLPDTLVTLSMDCPIPLSFISKLTNLQELIIKKMNHLDPIQFESIQYVELPRLRVLKFPMGGPTDESLINFLRINGKNLKRVHFDDSLNTALVELCPNLKSFHTKLSDDDVESLKGILEGLQQLESVEVECSDQIKSLEMIAKHSPKLFHELNIWFTGYPIHPLELFLERLKPVLTSWANRIPQKPLSLIIECSRTDRFQKEDMGTIENFVRSGVVKKFDIIRRDEILGMYGVLHQCSVA